MNIYYLDPCYIRQDRFHQLVRALKIKAIYYCLTERCDFLIEDPQDKEMVEFSCTVQKTSQDPHREPVHHFVNTLSYHASLNGEPIDDIVEDLFLESKCHTPYRNHMSTDDPNVLVLTDSDSLPEDASRYIINILNKRTGDTRYQDRICFARLSPFLKGINFPEIGIHYSNETFINFNWSTRFLNVKNKSRKPETFATIISTVTREERKISDSDKLTSLVSYFINEEGISKLRFWEEEEERAIELKREEQERSSDAEDYYREMGEDSAAIMNFLYGDW